LTITPSLQMRRRQSDFMKRESEEADGLWK